MSFTEMVLKEITDIVPGEFEFSHAMLTFTDTPKYKYVVVSGLYNGYPIYTDNLIGTLKTLSSKRLENMKCSSILRTRKSR